MPRLLGALVLLLAIAGTAGAQSLADVARREEVRRKDIKKPSRVLTNKDLKPSENPAPPPPPADGQTPAPAPGEAPPDKTEDQPKPEVGSPGNDEQAWRQKMADARSALERSEMFLDALQSKINGLWAEFTARDNYVERERIETERKKALAEFDRVKTEVDDRKKAITDLEEEARRANVPPGWLR